MDAYGTDSDAFQSFEKTVAMIQGFRALEGKCDIYLEIKGIEGESTGNIDYLKAIDVTRFEFFEYQIGSSGKGGGSGASKPRFPWIYCHCPASKAGPKLLLTCAKGDRLEYAYFAFCQSGSGAQFMVVKVKPAVISYYGQNLADFDDGAKGIVDVLGINYAEIELHYRPTGADGKLGGPLTFAYDTTGIK